MRLIDTTGETPVIIATGRRDANGIFRDDRTGFPFARELGDVLTFDGGQIDSADRSGEDRENGPDPKAKDKEPKLCEDPGPDAPHGASERAKVYQELVSALNNPQRPLPRGWAVSMINPRTGRRVYYDDCREIDGTIIEAKGPGFADLLRSDYTRKRIKTRWINQAIRHVQASGGRDVEWYFADKKAMDFARQIFDDYKNTSSEKEIVRVRTKYYPAVVR